MLSNLLSNVTSRPSFSIGSTRNGGEFNFCIGRKSLRVELYFHNDVNKEKFDYMFAFKEKIQSDFNGQIIWQRLNNKKASRIRFDMPTEDFQNKKINPEFEDPENCKIWINWYIHSMENFYNVLFPIWSKYKK